MNPLVKAFRESMGDDPDSFLTVDLLAATSTNLKLSAALALDGCPEPEAAALAEMCRVTAANLDKFLENRE